MDHQPLHRTLEEWKMKPLSEMRQWITVNQLYIKYCIHIQKKHKRNNTAGIQTFKTCRTVDTDTTTTKMQKKRTDL
eukprot:12272566-Ditylum_brightwellii.AAC.1